MLASPSPPTPTLFCFASSIHLLSLPASTALTSWDSCLPFYEGDPGGDITSFLSSSLFFFFSLSVYLLSRSLLPFSFLPSLSVFLFSCSHLSNSSTFPLSSPFSLSGCFTASEYRLANYSNPYWYQACACGYTHWHVLCTKKKLAGGVYYSCDLPRYSVQWIKQDGKDLTVQMPLKPWNYTSYLQCWNIVPPYPCCDDRGLKTLLSCWNVKSGLFTT